MAVTLNQMAEAYVQQVRQQLEAAKAQVAALETHLEECVGVTNANFAMSSTQSTQPTQTTETVSLPNPFENVENSQIVQ
jgi:hypothetical protein